MILGPDGREVDFADERESLVDITREFISGGKSGASPTVPSTAYRKTAMVFASVKAIGNTIAQLPFVVERDGEEVGKMDPISRLFNKPGNGLSRFLLWYGTLGALELAGNSLWKVGMAGKYPTSLSPLNPRRMSPNLTKDGSELLSYRLDNGYGSPTTLSVDEVIHFKYWNDNNPWWGLSTLEAAMLSVQTDQKARIYNSSFFDNSATLGGLLIAKDMQQGKATQLGDNINEKHRTPSRAHRTLVLGGDYTYYQIGIGQKDMDFLGMLNDARDTINAVFNVPGILTNNPNNRNYATAWAELRVFHLTNWGPKTIYIQDELENQFFDRFAPEYDGYFDKDGAPGVGDDLDAVINRARKLWDMGTPYNEIVKLLDLPLEERPWGDTWYMPVNLQPIGLVIQGVDDSVAVPEPGGEQPSDPEDDVEDDPESDPGIQGNSFRAADGLLRDLRRDTYFNAFSSVVRDLSSTFEEDVVRHFGRLRAETLEKIARYEARSIKRGFESEAAGLAFDLGRATLAIMPTVSDRISAAMTNGGNQLLADLGKEMDFVLAGGEASRLFLAHQEDVGRISETVHRHLVTALSKVIEAGGGGVELMSAAKRVFSKASNRAKMISKFEIHRAINAGRAAASTREAVKKLEWFASRDGSTRHGHRIDGEIVEFGKEFSNGLRWPGDVEASGSNPENLMGCGCTFLPVIE